MISYIKLSDDLTKNINLLDLRENELFFKLLVKLIKDKFVYFVGQKENIKIKKTSQTHLMEILYKLKQKIEWVEIKNSDNCPIDLYFVSDLKIKAKNYYSINSINDHNIKDIDQIIERAKFQMFNLNLRKKDNKYKIDNDELETFKDKIFKPLNVSSKILLWDQYIPISLAKIDKKTKQMTKNRYYHDYCNTLRFLEDELFKRSNNKIFCEILTMNKLEENWNFEHSVAEFFKIVQNYIRSLKNTKGKLNIKDYNKDYWDKIHSRLIVFKDKYDQLIAYCVLEPGLDFIKKEHKLNYGKEFRTRKYKFTPGNMTNFDEISSDLFDILSLNGQDLKTIN